MVFKVLNNSNEDFEKLKFKSYNGAEFFKHVRKEQKKLDRGIFGTILSQTELAAVDLQAITKFLSDYIDLPVLRGMILLYKVL